MKTTVTIRGVQYAIGELTVGQIQAILAAQVAIQPLLVSPFSFDRLDSRMIDALAHALARVIGADIKTVEAYPLATCIDALHDAGKAVIEVNSPYLTEQVTPAIERISAALTALLPTLQAAAPPESAPAP